MDSLLAWLEDLIYSLPAIIVAFSFHEFGHAYAAYRMGDPTARNEGRMTINPIAHIDPVGLIALLVFRFGWAKPVPVNPRNYRNYRTGEIVVSLAGVTMNLFLAAIGALGLAIFLAACGASILTNTALQKVFYFIYYFIALNCGLLVFNLIPIYPLDGYHVAEVLLAKHIGPKPFMFVRRYGFIILLGILLINSNSGFSFISYLTNLIMNGLIDLFSAFVSLFV